MTFLDFEKELVELHQKILQLGKLYQLGEKDKEKELRKLQREFRKKSKEIYTNFIAFALPILKHVKQWSLSSFKTSSSLLAFPKNTLCKLVYRFVILP